MQYNRTENIQINEKFFFVFKIFRPWTNHWNEQKVLGKPAQNISAQLQEKRAQEFNFRVRLEDKQVHWTLALTVREESVFRFKNRIEAYRFRHYSLCITKLFHSVSFTYLVEFRLVFIQVVFGMDLDTLNDKENVFNFHIDNILHGLIESFKDPFIRVGFCLI